MQNEPTPTPHLDERFGIRLLHPKKFSIQAKNLYLTYPQCPMPKEECMQRIKDHFDTNLDRCVVAAELHQDGNQHLHMYIGLHKRCNYKSATCLDFIAKQHGNYRAAANVRNVLRYITKDNQYVEHNIDCAKELEAQEKHKTVQSLIVAQKLVENKLPFKQIVDEHLGFFANSWQKINYFRSQYDALRIQEKMPFYGIKVPVVPELAKPWNWHIARWLAKNLQPNRPYKQQQLWIHGETNTGKTTLCQTLSTMFKTFWLTQDENWVDGLDESHELIIIDEFVGGRQIAFINQFTSGAPFPCIQRNKLPYLKTNNPPVIVCSNRSPDEVFHKVKEHHLLSYEAFEQRFDVVCVKGKINIDFRKATPNAIEEVDRVLPSIARATPSGHHIEHQVLERQNATVTQAALDKGRLLCVEELDSMLDGSAEEDSESVEEKYDEEVEDDELSEEELSERYKKRKDVYTASSPYEKFRKFL